MPWQASSTEHLRQEFVALASAQAVSLAELCRRYQISRTTGYKWLNRHKLGEPLTDRSRRPHHSPTRTPEHIATEVIALRQAHPAWGGRKIHHRLIALGQADVPAPSTITHVLRRAGLLHQSGAQPQPPWQRFEHPRPNDLWQMDFKGHIKTGSQRIDPLTVLDDHSRYNLILQSCTNCRTTTVQQHLTQTFQRYGLPLRINMDHGQPWGAPAGTTHGLSRLTIWLIRLGVRISFSRIGHPQTNGKDERFHRTLVAEVLNRPYANPAELQQAFDHWRNIYNHQRPHEALNHQPPASRYQPSPRPYPATLPEWAYGPDDQVAVVKTNGAVKFNGTTLKVSSALKDQPIAFRPAPEKDGCYHLYIGHHRFDTLNLNPHKTC